MAALSRRRCSSGLGLHQLFKSVQRLRRHRVDVELPDHDFAPGRPERSGAYLIAQQAFESVGEGLGIAWLAEYAATSGLDQFGKGSVARLHNRHADGQPCLDVQQTDLAVKRGGGEDRQVLVKGDLPGSIDVGKNCASASTPAAARKTAPLFLDEWFSVGPQPPPTCRRRLLPVSRFLSNR